MPIVLGLKVFWLNHKYDNNYPTTKKTLLPDLKRDESQMLISNL